MIKLYVWKYSRMNVCVNISASVSLYVSACVHMRVSCVVNNVILKCTINFENTCVQLIHCTVCHVN